jgi:DNA-binding transcriptional regulator PaaX
MEVDGRWDVGDPDVDAFVDASIASFAAWDLVIYLNRNPDTYESLSGLAVVLARPESDLKPAVRRLAETGVLVSSDEAGEAYYRLTDDAALRDVVARFLEMAARREHRLEFVRRVLAHITGA